LHSSSEPNQQEPNLGKVYSELLLLFVVVVVFFGAVTSPVSFWLAATAGI
jgi:hypothetical protein